MPSSEQKAGGFIAKNPENGDFNQYWYSAKTIQGMVEAVEAACGDDSRVAFVSTPSVYFSLTDAGLKQRSRFFDIDKKWEKDPCFVYYDFNDPEGFPEELKGQFDMVVIDPPFITRQVWEKYQQTAKVLVKDPSKYLVLNSTVQENLSMMQDLFGSDIEATKFQPSIPHLVYQYHFFSNFKPEALAEWNPEIPSDD